MFKELFSSEVRANLGETLDKVYDGKLPVVVKKKVAGGSKDFIFISKEVFTKFLNDVIFNVKVFNEDDGSITLELGDLDLISNGNTIEDAALDMANDIIIYADEYIKNIDFYSNSPNRKNHLKYIIKVANFTDKDSIINSFNFIYQQ